MVVLFVFSALYILFLLGCFVYSLCSVLQQKRRTLQAEEDYYDHVRIHFDRVVSRDLM